MNSEFAIGLMLAVIWLVCVALYIAQVYQW